MFNFNRITHSAVIEVGVLIAQKLKTNLEMREAMAQMKRPANE